MRFAITWSYPLGSIYWFNREQPGSPPIPDGHAADLEELLRHPMGGFRGQRRATPSSAGTSSRRETVAFRDSPLRLDAAARDHRRGQRHARHPPHRHRHPPGGRRDLGLGGPAHPGRLLRRHLHPCLELPAGAANLFPALERTLRETEFTYNQLPTGGLTFRQRLPLGSGFDIIGPCADGHFGAIIKTYRDWKNCRATTRG